MASDYVANDELLYRSVRRTEVTYENGRPRISSQAFADKQRKPSVDRAKLCDQDPTRTQMSPTDSVVSIYAYQVRGITNVVGRDEHGQEFCYRIDVIPDPRPDNPAHALIIAAPPFAKNGGFKKLLGRIARLAEVVLHPPEDG